MVRDEEPSRHVKHCQRVGFAIITSFHVTLLLLYW